MNSFSRRAKSGHWLQGAALVLLTICVMFPACFNGYIWDDGPHIADNANLRSVGGLVAIWTQPSSMPQYYPVYHSALWAAYRLWGAAPWGYHTMNVLVHGAAAAVLWGLLRRLKVGYAWFVAALFAVHPLQVETVGWAMEFKSVLSGLFYFLALRVLLPCWGVGEEETGGDVGAVLKRRRYFAGTLLFLFSLLSKSVTATLPAVILLLVWWKRGRITKSEWVRAVPLFVIGAASGFLTSMLERARVGAQGPEWDIGFIDRVLIAGRAVAAYVEKLFWPRNLAFFYPRWAVDSSSLVQYLFPAGVVVLVAMLWLLRKRIGRGPLTGVLFFMGTLFPALGFVNVYPMRFSYVADHFQYLACIGVFAVVGGAMAAVGRSRGGRWLAPGFCVLVLGALGSLTFQRTRVFYDDYTLFADNVRAGPESWAGQIFFAGSCAGRGDLSGQLEHAALGVALNPNDVDGREALSGALSAAGDARGARLLALPRILSGEDPRLLEILAAAFGDAGDRGRAEEFSRRAAEARAGTRRGVGR